MLGCAKLVYKFSLMQSIVCHTEFQKEHVWMGARRATTGWEDSMLMAANQTMAGTVEKYIGV